MKKIKQILAMAGVILLVTMYLSTLVCALFDTGDTMFLFRASVLCTVLVPVLLWGYTVIYRLSKGNQETPQHETETETMQQDTNPEQK